MAPADKLIYLANLANGDRRLYVGTHPNKFHLDEIAAIALIRKYYKGPMKVIRSRDWDDLKKCQIVVDVGGKNEITDDHVYFDHHEAFESREVYFNGVKYAACGKLAAWLYEDDGYASWLQFLLNEFLYTVQAVDNGQNYKQLNLNPPIFQITPLMNPTVIETNEDKQLELFDQTVDMVLTIIERLQAKYNVIRNTKFLFENEIVKYKGDGILVLSNPPDMNMIQQYNAVAEPDQIIKLVVFPDFAFAKYKVHTVNKEEGSNETIIRLPKAWRGYKGKELSIKSNIENGYIVSANGYFGTWRTLDHALQAARKTVKLGETD